MSTGSDEFSLLGGPLHWLGSRSGLVRGRTNTVPIGLALGLFLWIVLIALTLVEGLARQIPTLVMVGGHVRLLLAIPLFFACEAWFDPRCAFFVREIVRAEVVPEAAVPALQSEVARVRRWTDAWLPEAIGLLAAVLMLGVAPYLELPGVTAVYANSHVAGGPMLLGKWYGLVCLTVFRFLMLRWLWRLAIWGHFLWRVSRLPLRLVPIHPDGVAGLGYLEVVHTDLAPLVLSISVVQCASFAGEIASGTMAFEAIYPALALILLADAVLFIGPLSVFGPKLWVARMRGLSDYMVLGSRYVNDFDRKWLGRAAAPGTTLLGTPDLQSLADLAGSVAIVRHMRLVPVSWRMLLTLASAALLPVLPLLLLKYPLTELIAKFLERLTGF